MDQDLRFLDLVGLDANQVNQIKNLLHPSNLGSEVEFPWNNTCNEESILKKGNISSLNVHAPAFETYISVRNANSQQMKYVSNIYNNGSPDVLPLDNNSPVFRSRESEKNIENQLPAFANGMKTSGNNLNYNTYSQLHRMINGDQTMQDIPVTLSASSFKLNPTVSSFVPQSSQTYLQPVISVPQDEAVLPKETVVTSNESTVEPLLTIHNFDISESGAMPRSNEKEELSNEKLQERTQSIDVHNGPQTVVVVSSATCSVNTTASSSDADCPKVVSTVVKPVLKSWAQIVRSGQSPAVPLPKPIMENKNKEQKSDKDTENLNVEDDRMALILGKHLHELTLDFKKVHLQPRGLINRRNWCYINATLQALLGCSAFYTLIRNLPIGPAVDRGKSATPVIDSMVKVTYEFAELPSSQEELLVGQPFQPDFMYDMLRDMKSDCLKGQQEDAEEFLSFILNSMHEEMVTMIKNHERKNNINLNDEVKENGDQSDGEDEWQVIGSKHKGMVTRKVVEHRTPISDLLGGQIKSYLTTSGSKTSASIQPFFTLQLDIQSDSVNSVSEALKEMTTKEPIQGYTCAKTKQEVEAYNHIALQKLSPVLILHLKRFVYNKNGGCKKVMKKTDYPLELELNRDLFSSDVKKSQRIRTYKLFAVMYHDGEEAIKGHYVTDVYNYGSQTWIRCDDRQISAVTETQVLSHSPPRVPYLLFYQES